MINMTMLGIWVASLLMVSGGVLAITLFAL
jgi:hypothetical protein